MVTPLTSALAVVKTTSGVTGTLTNEAMSVVDMTSMGYPANSVYEITDPTKRYLDTGTIPTFTIDSGGGAIALTPASIEYAGGRVILTTPTAGTVVCASGKYFTTISTLLGGSVAKINNSETLEDVTLLGDAYIRRYPTIRDFSVTLDTFAMKTCAEYTTSGGNANSHVTFTHLGGGLAGNSYTISLVDPGAGPTPLSVAVSGTAVAVTLQTSASPAIITTGTQLAAAINDDPGCKFIQMGAAVKATETGAGIVSDTGGSKSLTGGLDITDHTLKYGVNLIIQIYFSTSADSRLEGYCYLESIEDNLNPKEVHRENLTFKGNGKLYFRPA